MGSERSERVGIIRQGRGEYNGFRTSGTNDRETRKRHMTAKEEEEKGRLRGTGQVLKEKSGWREQPRGEAGGVRGEGTASYTAVITCCPKEGVSPRPQGCGTVNYTVMVEATAFCGIVYRRRRRGVLRRRANRTCGEMCVMQLSMYVVEHTFLIFLSLSSLRSTSLRVFYFVLF